MSDPVLLAMVLSVAAVVGLTGFFALSGSLLGPKTRHEGDADMPYETGLPPLSPAHERMTVLYWRFAVLFVVFDVDLAFLLPWALCRPALDWDALVAITAFTGILLLMLAYFWRKGVLECR